MRIGFDGRGVRPEPDGIGHASLRLLEGMIRVARGCEFTVWNLPGAHHHFPRDKSLRLITCPHHHLSWHTLHRFGRSVDSERLDVFHAPFFLAPLSCRTPLVITVHDMMALDDPDFFEGPLWRFKRWFHRRYVPRLIERAQSVICVSSTVADRVRELGKEDADVIPIHHGIDATDWTRTPDADLRHRLDALGIPQRFFLHVGRWRPYKNLPTLFAAYRLYRDRSRREPVSLVCCRGGGSTDDERFLDTYGIRDTTVIVDAPDDELVQGLVHRATALVQPSRYEGFGLPVLEAMAAGTLVIVSQGGALPEVTGDVALTHRVGDHETLSTHLERVATDPDLCRELTIQGQERAQSFTIECMAQATLGVYERVHASRQV